MKPFLGWKRTVELEYADPITANASLVVNVAVNMNSSTLFEPEDSSLLAVLAARMRIASTLLLSLSSKSGIFFLTRLSGFQSDVQGPYSTTRIRPLMPFKISSR